MRNPFLLATDASSIILLHKTRLFSNLSSACEFQITISVQNELDRGASSSEIKKIKSHTKLIEIDINHIADLPKKLSSADASVLNLFYQTHSHAVLSDDQAILKYCKSKNINHYCCLSLLAPLVQFKSLSPDEANSFFPRIKEAGRYSVKIVQIARTMLDSSINEIHRGGKEQE